MDNLRQRSRSETRGRFASRPGSRHTSRENSRDRSRATSRERRKNEMRPVNFENFDTVERKKYEDSSDDSNWDIILNKNNGKKVTSYAPKKMYMSLWNKPIRSNLRENLVS